MDLICGVGVDSVEIDRIAQSMRRRGFLDRLFTSEECAHFHTRGDPPESVAGSFAAKEAISKALGEPLRMADWKQICIRRENGRPSAVLTGELRARMARKQGRQIWISIAHDKTRATAMAIMEG